MDGPEVRFAVERIVKLGDVSQRVKVLGSFGEPVTVTLLDDDDAVIATVETASDWWPGMPVWQGTVDDEDISVHVRPILNGYDLAYRGVTAETRVYTKRESELTSLMPVRIPPDLSKFLLCPMPGLIKALMVEEGQAVQAGYALAMVDAIKM